MTVFSIFRFLLIIIIGFYLEKCVLGHYQSAPHIIVIMVDDLGWNDVGFHGSSQIPTPNIDALAYNGVILNRHYVLPSCTPTRAAFFTGKYPIRMGMQGEGIRGGEPRGMPPAIKILPEYLRDLGYSPKLIGKWHLGFHTRQHTPLHRGFDYFFGFYNSHITYYDHKYTHENMSGFDLHRGDVPAYDIQDHQYVTDLFTEEAVKLISQHDPINPLYLQVNHLGVHAPIEAPPDNYHSREFAHIRDPSRHKYARMVARIDDSVGRIVSTLGDKDMLKNSIIIFMTDNGAPTIGRFRNSGSNAPLRGTKYTLYEGGVRGVAAIWSPRLHALARVSNYLMHVTDWLPTLYAAAGGNVAELIGAIDGIDQWPHLSEGAPDPREILLLNIDEVSRTEGAIFRQHKLVRGTYKRGYYDNFYGDTGNDPEVPSYNYTSVLHSLVAASIRAHLGQPMTQTSTMTKLREQATVFCLREKTFSHCNETDCLFDIVNDPCEATNIAKQYPKVVRDMDRYLEKFSRILVKQPKWTIDWMADPRRRNNTWEPWLVSGMYGDYYNNAANIVSTLAVCAHLAMAVVLVGLRGFI